MGKISDIIQEINTNLPDNNAQEITAKKLRDTLIDTIYNVNDAYDITINNNSQYASLSDALGNNGANVPANIRKPGMTVKFYNSTTSNYEYWKYNLINTADNMFTNLRYWIGVDAEPFPNSKNLVESGGVYKFINNITSYYASSFTEGKYWSAQDKNIGDQMYENMSNNAGFAGFRVEVQNGDQISLKTIGGQNARAYILTDSNRIIYEMSPSNVNYSSGTKFTISQDGYLYVNTTADFLQNVEVTKGYSVTKSVERELENVKNDVQTQQNEIDTIISKIGGTDTYTGSSDFTNGKYYSLNQEVGETAPENMSTLSGYACFRTEVKAGDVITLKTYGGANGRAYALTDTNRTILSIAPETADYTSGITLTVEQDGYLYANNHNKSFALENVEVTIKSNKLENIENDVEQLKNDVDTNTENIQNLQTEVNEVKEITEFLTEVTNYTGSSDFTNGKYYILTQEIGGTAPEKMSNSSAYACFRTEVKAGDIITIKTYGGSNARAYALTDSNRIIYEVAPVAADYTSGLTITATQDGYLYANDWVNRFALENVEVTIKSNKLENIENDVEQLKTDVDDLSTDVEDIKLNFGASKIYNPQLDLRKNNLKILDIGNSFTGDAVHYLNNFIDAQNEADTDSIPLNFSLYKIIMSGSNFQNWYDTYNDNCTKAYAVSFQSGTADSDVPTGSGAANNGALFRNVLNSIKWDMIIIHEESYGSASYEEWETNNERTGYLKEYIRILKLTNPQAKIGFYIVHSVPSNSSSNPEHSSLLRWQKIVNSAKWMMTNYGVDFVVPYGTAIQSIRQCSFVDTNELSSDGLHCANGLADYTAGACYFQTLFGARNGVTCLGNTFRITVDETVGGQVSVDDTKALLAQKAALLACSDMFNIYNPENINI